MIVENGCDRSLTVRAIARTTDKRRVSCRGGRSRVGDRADRLRENPLQSLGLVIRHGRLEGGHDRSRPLHGSGRKGAWLARSAGRRPLCVARCRGQRDIALGIGLQWAGLPHMDSVAAVVVVAFMVWSRAELIRDGLRVLLDTLLEEKVLQTMRDMAQAQPEGGAWLRSRGATRAVIGSWRRASSRILPPEP